MKLTENQKEKVEKAGTEEEKTFYEAFPIYEKELLGAEITKDNGFSAYIPESEKDRVLGILVYTSGQYYIKKESK